jgi:hypothetical protein
MSSAGAQMLHETAEGGRFEFGADGRVEIGHGIGSGSGDARQAPDFARG